MEGENPAAPASLDWPRSPEAGLDGIHEIQPVEENQSFPTERLHHPNTSFSHSRTVTRVNQHAIVEADLTFATSDADLPSAPRPALMDDSVELGESEQLLAEDGRHSDQQLPMPLFMAQQPGPTGHNQRNRQRRARRHPEQTSASGLPCFLTACWINCATFVCPHVHANGRRRILWRLGFRLYINAFQDIDPVVKFALITLSFTGAYMIAWMAARDPESLYEEVRGPGMYSWLPLWYACVRDDLGKIRC